MNARVHFFVERMACVAIAIFVSVSGALLLGCASSEETQTGTTESTTESPQPTMMEPMQKTMDSLTAENATLRVRLTKLEQENRNLTAKTAELETKLAGVREKKEMPPPPKAAANPEMEYERGVSLQHEGHYQEAISVFMGLINTGAPENLESNCHYWIGEGYYGLRQYKEALPHFEKVFSYPRTTKKDDAQLMIANCYNRTGDKARAKSEYQKLISQFPASPYVQRAKDELAKLK